LFLLRTDTEQSINESPTFQLIFYQMVKKYFYFNDSKSAAKYYL